MVPPFPLLFFGGKISTGREDFQNVIKIDDWIKFQASPKIAKLVKVSFVLILQNFHAQRVKTVFSNILYTK